MSNKSETLEEMMQREIDELRLEIVNLKNRLRAVAESLREFLPKDEE
jgi:hypothetical protein